MERVKNSEAFSGETTFQKFSVDETKLRYTRKEEVKIYEEGKEFRCLPESEANLSILLSFVLRISHL